MTPVKGAPKNCNFFSRARKHRAENRNVHRVHEDLSTELTRLSRKKCIFRGALKLIYQLTLVVVLVFPAIVYADQTDTRLDSLFTTLQNSDDPEELQAAETSIWEIWFESGKEEVDTLMDEAGLAVQNGKLGYAENLYSQVIENAPKFSEGWNRRATVRYHQKDYEGSLEDIQHTLLLEPRHFGATWGLGMILGSQRNFSAAITAFERLLELKPNAREAKPRIELLKEELARSAV